MANNLKRIYIGAICNRDLEVLGKIKHFLLKNYNIALIDLMKAGMECLEEKYLKRCLKKYTINFLVVKLTTQETNDEIYNLIRKVAPNIPVLNSLDSVKICESRKRTFQALKKIKTINIPKYYHSIEEIRSAFRNGSEIIVKLDSHNIPNLPKNDRIVGIAKNDTDLNILLNDYAAKQLFFQEYLGEFERVNKVYVIGQWIVSIKSYNRLHSNNMSPLDLIHIRTPLDDSFREQITTLGKKLGMSIFGVDYIKTRKSFYVVDVNDFPSFRNIPEGVSLISDHIYNLIRRKEDSITKKVKIKS